MSPSVQPNDKRTLVLNATDVMYPFYAGEGVNIIWIAACEHHGIGELEINDVIDLAGSTPTGIRRSREPGP